VSPRTRQGLAILGAALALGVIADLLARLVPARLDLALGLGALVLALAALAQSGLAPLPARLVVQVGEPMHLGHGPEDAENRALVAQLTEDVRERVQSMLDGLRTPLRHVFW